MMKQIDAVKFNESAEYRNEVLQLLNGLCSKGVGLGLNEEEEQLRIEINKVVNNYYFGM